VIRDRIISWAEQGGRDGVRIWHDGDAVAVGTPDLFRRDRLAVAGVAEPVAALVKTALGELGPTYRVFGETALVEHVARTVPGLEVVGRFGWMDALTVDAGTDGDGVGGEGPATEAKPRWLDPAEYPEVNAILDAAFPDSYARPGLPGVKRWAGVRDGSGALVAVAADAWSAPGIGFMSGVATDPAAQGRGNGEAVCRFTLRELIAEHGRAALSVDSDNYPAIRVYRRLGLDWGDVAVARVVG
jgi:ribosomal protein S18 acetylase RimI-like enzyme